MGIYDRDYVRNRSQAQTGGGGIARVRLVSFNTWLIIINIAMAFIAGFGRGSLLGLPIPDLWGFGYFSTSKAFLQVQGGSITATLEIWRFITFQFLHGGWDHLFFNMIGLFVFGGLVERQLGFKKYAAFYLVCGIFGALMYLVLNLLGTLFGIQLPGVLFNDPSSPLVGASAGVFGVIVACAYIAPNEVIQLLFPPIPLRMRTFAYGYVAIAVINLLWNANSGRNNAGGDAAHLGGALAGYYFIRNSHLLRDFFDVFNDSRKPKGKRRTISRTTRREEDEDEVGRLLAKIKREGLDSLTESEKRTLHRASEAKRRTVS